MDLQAHLKKSFFSAEDEISKINDEILSLEGMSGNLTRHFYNNILSMEGVRYLEVGTWLGSSTFSAMYRNKADIVCIDNWSQFSEGRDVKGEFLKNLERFQGENKVRAIEGDCFKIDPKTLGKFNIYLYDGPHERDDHYRALTHFYECLDDEFIFICDDWDWASPRQGTFDAIRDLGLEVVYSVERSLNEGDLWKPGWYAKEMWWNGIWAGVLRKNGGKNGLNG